MDLTPEQIATMTAYVDIHMPPPDEPVALFIFGTNQLAPIEIAATRHRRGMAPLIITTGGVNRHDNRIEGPWLRDELIARGVPASAIRVEQESANTEQNVANSLDYIREADDTGLPIAVVSKWYHRRTIHALATHGRVPTFYAIGYEPLYAGYAITRDNWPKHPDGLRRVVRESEECRRRAADGSLVDVVRDGVVWRARL